MSQSSVIGQDLCVTAQYRSSPTRNSRSSGAQWPTDGGDRGARRHRAGTARSPTVAVVEGSGAGTNGPPDAGVGKYGPLVPQRKKRMEDATCIFCESPSTKSGEHVWPSWFLRMFSDEGPFHLEINGNPDLKRDGDLRTTSSLEGTRVPMCQPHNAALNRRFEEPAKEIIRSAKPRNADSRWQTLSADDVRAMAEWVIKVGLLSKHPAATFDNPSMDEQVERWAAANSDLYEWMVTGAPVPDQLTAFASFQSHLVDPDPVGILHVPRMVTEAGVTRISQHVAFSVLDLSFDLIYHPARRIEYPHVPARAIEVSPARASGHDLQMLTPSHPSDVRIVVSGSVELLPDRLGRDLPPISVDTDLSALVGSGLVRVASM